MDKMMGLDIADKHNCVLVYEPTYLYRKSPTRSRAAYVWGRLIFDRKKNSLDKPLSYLSLPRLQAMACKWI